MQISAPKYLKPYIKHYLFLRNTFEVVKTYRFFTDGNMGMVISLHNSTPIVSVSDNHILPTSYVYGQIEEYRDIIVPKNHSFVIVVFQPMGLYHSLGTPVQALSNQIFEAEIILGNSFRNLYDQLLNAKNITEIVTLLNSYFKQLVSSDLSLKLQLSQAAINYVIAKRGDVLVSQISHYLGYSDRQVQRLFNETIGISPLKFFNIARLHCYLGILKSGTIDLTIPALESGYFDQSHLNRVFKKFVGVTPKQYISSSKATVNLVGLE